MGEGEKALLQCHPLLTLPILILGLPDQASPPPHPPAKRSKQALTPGRPSVYRSKPCRSTLGTQEGPHSGPEHSPNQSTSFPAATRLDQAKPIDTIPILGGYMCRRHPSDSARPRAPYEKIRF